MNNHQPNWSKHLKDTADKPPSPLVIEAVKYVIHKNKAVDIGGGALKDTRYLLSQGFETTVIDQAEEVAEMAQAIHSDKLHCHITSFADFIFPANTFDLASAMYALPFNGEKNFDTVVTNIKQSLVKGGIFVGNFFGVRDEWSGRPTMAFHTKEEVEKLFSDSEVITFEEKEYDGTLANGQPKHWHIFNVITRKVSL